MTAQAAAPLRYRPEIDGLRAVAVLGVVAYHAAPGLLPGGFTGVDVFFVVSGYLITRLILDRHARGRFSFAAFYAARIRRIVPALAAVLAATTAAAIWLLPPGDLARFGEGLAWAAGFASNLLFLSQSGYFDPPAAENLLLHLWSLSVEEQFYLVAPLGLFVIARTPLRRWTPWLLGLAAVLSLAWAEWYLARGGANAAFYLLQARFWELMLGGVLASARLAAPRTARTRDALAGVGLLLIAGGLVFLGGVRFPGATALVPCLGAALVIHATDGEGRVAQTLRAPVLVGIGLISYSLYLWHWPLLTLPRMLLSRPLTPMETALCVGLAFAAAWASWRFVERPFRHVAGRGATVRALILGPLVLTVLLGVGLVLFRTGGLPQRAGPAVLAAEASGRPAPSIARGCHLDGAAYVVPGEPCTAGPDPARALLWGDSHALHLLPPMQDWSAGRGLGLRQATKSGCPPLTADAATPLPADCRAFNAEVLARMDGRLSHVVLAGRWTRGAEPPVRTADVQAVVEAIRARVGPEVRIVLVGPAPEFGFAPSTCYARTAFLRRDTARCDRAALVDPAAAADVERGLDAVSGAVLVRPRAVLCRAGVCPTRSGDRFVYRDDDHLTPFGARRLGPALSAALDDPSGEAEARGDERTGVALP